MQKLLILTDWYLPAYKAGGPVRSIENLARLLKDDFQIFILTGDRDLGDRHPFEGITPDTWILTDHNHHVRYVSPGNQNRNHIKKILLDIAPDILYLNSMYSRSFTLLPLSLLSSLPPDIRTILCPRGMLKDSALQYKSLKKKLFLYLMKFLHLGRRISFHATDSQEATDIRKWFGRQAKLTIVPNVPALLDYQPCNKQENQLRVLFVGRIHPVKNLKFALETLQHTNAKLHFEIIGNIEDEKYWQECSEVINQLPSNVTVKFSGALPHKSIIRALTDCHLFYLPTQGENFGHAIFEALSVGRPVLISDQTPWRTLMEQNAGRDISLNNKAEFANYIGEAAAMHQAAFDLSCQAAHNLAKHYISSHHFLQKYRQLFGCTTDQLG